MNVDLQIKNKESISESIKIDSKKFFIECYVC